MTSHDTCTSGTSQIPTIASLLWLKMEILIPPCADCEVWSVIKYLNAQSIAPIEIHRQLCQVYDHIRLDDQHISCRSSAGRCLTIIHSKAWALHPVISIFSYTSRNSCLVSISIFRMTEAEMSVTQWFQSQAADFYDTGYESWSYGMVNVSIPEINTVIKPILLGPYIYRVLKNNVYNVSGMIEEVKTNKLFLFYETLVYVPFCR